MTDGVAWTISYLWFTGAGGGGGGGGGCRVFGSLLIRIPFVRGSRVYEWYSLLMIKSTIHTHVSPE